MGSARLRRARESHDSPPGAQNFGRDVPGRYALEFAELERARAYKRASLALATLRVYAQVLARLRSLVLDPRDERASGTAGGC